MAQQRNTFAALSPDFQAEENTRKQQEEEIKRKKMEKIARDERRAKGEPEEVPKPEIRKEPEPKKEEIQPRYNNERGRGQRYRRRNGPSYDRNVRYVPKNKGENYMEPKPAKEAGYREEQYYPRQNQYNRGQEDNYYPQENYRPRRGRYNRPPREDEYYQQPQEEAHYIPEDSKEIPAEKKEEIPKEVKKVENNKPKKEKTQAQKDRAQRKKDRKLHKGRKVEEKTEEGKGAEYGFGAHEITYEEYQKRIAEKNKDLPAPKPIAQVSAVVPKEALKMIEKAKFKLEIVKPEKKSKAELVETVTDNSHLLGAVIPEIERPQRKSDYPRKFENEQNPRRDYAGPPEDNKGKSYENWDENYRQPGQFRRNRGFGYRRRGGYPRTYNNPEEEKPKESSEKIVKRETYELKEEEFPSI